MENKSEERLPQRRIEERSDCDIEARVELGDRLAISCHIKDLSMQGCKIQITDALFLPAEFDLLVPVLDNTFQRRRVRMQWRKADLVGCEFISLPT